MKNIQELTPPRTGMTLFKWLCLGKLNLNPLWHKTSYRIKFCLRAIFLSPNTFRWLNHLVSYPLLGYYLSKQTNLPCKLQRPYLASCFSNKESLDALINHYDFMANHNDKMTQAIYNKKAYILAILIAKNEEQLTVSIKSSDKFAREGEITLYLTDKDEVTLATLTFSIIQYEQKATLFIAGLQGANNENARQIIQQATKASYGLFPKRLIVESALNFARFFELEQVIAVGNTTHIYNSWRYKSRFKQLHSDYNDFWQTLDAKENEQKLFSLPLTIARKPIEDIASKKRSEYRNRYTLLDNLSVQLTEQLTKLQ